MRYILGALLLIFLGTIGIFALENLRPVTVQFLTKSVELPFAFLAVAIYVLGMLSGWSVVSFLKHSIRRVRADSGSESSGKNSEERR